MNKTKIQSTSELGTHWWNDSNDHKQLLEAVRQGAVGATSNPVVTEASIATHSDVRMPVVDQLTDENPDKSEDELA